MEGRESNVKAECETTESAVLYPVIRQKRMLIPNVNNLQVIQKEFMRGTVCTKMI